MTISKTKAEEIASKMANKAFKDSIDKLSSAVNEAVEDLVKKYVPKEVLEIASKYADYFDLAKMCQVSTFYEQNGYSSRSVYIAGYLSFYIPNKMQFITVTNVEYENVKELLADKKNAERKKETLKNQIFEAVFALKTTKRILESLPEVAPYLPLETKPALPAIQYDDLRKTINKLLK